MDGFLTRVVQCLLVMAFSPTGLLVSGASINNMDYVNELPHQCRQYNDTVTCDCSNSTEVQDVLNALPNTLYGLTINMTTSMLVPLGNMSHLKNLQYFRITGGSSVTATILEFPENTFENLTKLKEVHVNVFAKFDINATVKYTTHLEVMDFSGTKLNAFSDIQNTLQFVNKTTLKGLLLSNIQLIGNTAFNGSLSIDTLFNKNGPLSLEQLDVSKNMLGIISPSIITKLPCLKMLDVSFNNLVYINDALMIEILLHPFLELINVENQGQDYRVNGQTKRRASQPSSETEESSQQSNLKTERTKYQPILQMERTSYKFDWQNPRKDGRSDLETKDYEHVSRTKLQNSDTNQHLNWRFLSDSQNQASEIISHFIQCINQKDDHNISYFPGNLSMVCSTVKCILPVTKIVEMIPCKAFEGVYDVLDANCLYWTRLPLLRKTKIFILRHLNWIEKESKGLSQQICINDSPLHTLDFSANGNWLPNSFLDDVLNQTNFESALKELKFFNLSGNIFTSFPRSSFSNLQKIDLSHNKLQHMNLNVCTLYPKLTHLNLTANQLSVFGRYWINECKLLEYLDLSKNLINHTECLFDIPYAHQLKIINLNDNKIDILPKCFTNQLDKLVGRKTVHNSEELQLTFTGNNIVCRCNEETMEFIQWFQSTRVDMPNKSSYTCSSSQGELFLSHIDVNNLRTICFPSLKELIWKIVSIALSLVMLVLSILALYRYRWRVHYNIVKCFHRVKCHHRHEAEELLLPEVDSTTMRYDAFVSYCAEDRFWVHDCLMKTLESDRYGFKLCIHYRDFPVGDEIASVIVRSIRESRKVIIVLSEVAISRPWCQYEFEVALSEAVKRRSQLVMIKLGQIKLEEVDNSLAWVMDNHTYLEWHANADAQKLFWLKLLRTMYGDFSSGLCGCCLDGRQITSKEVAAASSPQ